MVEPLLEGGVLVYLSIELHKRVRVRNLVPRVSHLPPPPLWSERGEKGGWEDERPCERRGTGQGKLYAGRALLTSSDVVSFMANDVLRYEPKIDSLRVMTDRSNSSSFFFFSFSSATSFSLICWRSFSSCALAILLISRLNLREDSLLASISLLATPEKDTWRCRRRGVLLSLENTGFDC